MTFNHTRRPGSHLEPVQFFWHKKCTIKFWENDHRQGKIHFFFLFMWKQGLIVSKSLFQQNSIKVIVLVERQMYPFLSGERPEAEVLRWSVILLLAIEKHDWSGLCLWKQDKVQPLLLQSLEFSWKHSLSCLGTAKKESRGSSWGYYMAPRWPQLGSEQLPKLFSDFQRKKWLCF